MPERLRASVPESTTPLRQAAEGASAFRRGNSAVYFFFAALGLLDEHEAFALFPLFLGMQGIAVTSSMNRAGSRGDLPEAREHLRPRCQYV
jgi:hypothetical protein